MDSDIQLGGEQPSRQTLRFLLLYVLAAAGGAIAYVPFLTLLLPLRVSDLVGAQDIEWLAYLTLLGAITASLSNIFFGWMSDITRSRRGWIIAGLLLCCLFLVSFSAIERAPQMMLLIVLWQIALNMMLAPIAAWAGDCIPDGQKGMLGGLLSFAPAMGALVGAIITIPGFANADQRLWWVAGMSACCILPVLLFGRPRNVSEIDQGPLPAQPDSEHTSNTSRPLALAPIVSFKNRRITQMWIARLLMQISEAALFAYLLFWFRSINPDLSDSTVAQIFGGVLIFSIPLSLLAGKWIDRHHQPFLPLALCALVAAAGLVLMMWASSTQAAIASYVLFSIATTIFLSLHSGQTLRVLPRPERRGRDLGLFNLTNTVPSMVMPTFVLVFVPQFGFGPLLGLLAIIAILAAIILWRMPPAALS